MSASSCCEQASCLCGGMLREVGADIDDVSVSMTDAYVIDVVAKNAQHALDVTNKSFPLSPELKHLKRVCKKPCAERTCDKGEGEKGEQLLLLLLGATSCTDRNGINTMIKENSSVFGLSRNADKHCIVSTVRVSAEPPETLAKWVKASESWPLALPKPRKYPPSHPTQIPRADLDWLRGVLRQLEEAAAIVEKEKIEKMCSCGCARGVVTGAAVVDTSAREVVAMLPTVLLNERDIAMCGGGGGTCICSGGDQDSDQRNRKRCRCTCAGQDGGGENNGRETPFVEHPLLSVLREASVRCRTKRASDDLMKDGGSGSNPHKATTTVKAATSAASVAPEVDTSSNQDCRSYLCTDLDVVTLTEPCVMCCMALVHSRAKRLLFRGPNVHFGGCTVYSLQLNAKLNHKFHAYEGLGVHCCFVS